MIYLEWFVTINFCWGLMTLIFIPMSERNKFSYTNFAKFLLIFSWCYLVSCVPIFKDGLMIPESMSTYFWGVAIILSIEVWIVMLLTMLAIGLAKTAHDSTHKSYMVMFHKPLNKYLKPLWFVIAILNIVNSGYCFVKIHPVM